MPILKRKNEDFFKEWTPEMAYVLGFFAADGYMIENKRGGCFIDFYSVDREMLENIRRLVHSNHKITIRKSNHIRWSDSYRLQIGSKRWYSDLLRLGFTNRKSFIMCVPKIPAAYLGHFVRGYFDGDGCVSFGKYWRKDRKTHTWVFTTRFISGSREFLDGLLKILKPFVSRGFIYKKNRAYELVFAQHASVALFGLMYQDRTLGNYLRRKYLIFEKALKVLNLRA